MPAAVHERSAGRSSGTGFQAERTENFRRTPLEQVRTLFVGFCQGLFAAAPPGEYHWNIDEEQSEIIIRDENPINVDTVGARPAINFTIGGVSFYHVGMDDLIDFRFDTGRKTKGMLVPGTMSINCSARSDIECHNIAWIVSEYIWLLRELFLQRGFFELGRGIQITPPSSPGTIITGDSGDEWYTSSAVIPWQFARKSSFSPLGKRIVHSILQQFQVIDPVRPVGSFGPADGGHERPFLVTEQLPESFAPGASDARGKTPDPAGTRSIFLPIQPHPLNPAKLVIVKTVRPYRAGLNPPTTR